MPVSVPHEQCHNHAYTAFLIHDARSAGKIPIRKMARTPPQCCRLTPTKMEGRKVPEWRKSKSSLIELIGETADAADAVGDVDAVAVRILILCLKFALREQVQESAIDRVVQVEFDLSAWRLYLFHPCQAIGGLLHREHFPCVLFHGTIAFPQLQSRTGAIRLDIRSKIRSALFAERVLQCR